MFPLIKWVVYIWVIISKLSIKIHILFSSLELYFGSIHSFCYFLSDIFNKKINFLSIHLLSTINRVISHTFRLLWVECRTLSYQVFLGRKWPRVIIIEFRRNALSLTNFHFFTYKLKLLLGLFRYELLFIICWLILCFEERWWNLLTVRTDFGIELRMWKIATASRNLTILYYLLSFLSIEYSSPLGRRVMNALKLNFIIRLTHLQ